MYKKSELVFNLLLIPIDFLMVFGSFVLAYLIRVKVQDKPVLHNPGALHYLNTVLLVAPVWILIFALVGLYTIRSGRGRIYEASRVFIAASAGVMLLIVLDYASKKPIFPAKAIPIYAWGLTIVLVSLARIVVWYVQKALFQQGVGVRRILLIGAHPAGEMILGEMEHSRSLGYEVVGVLDDTLHKGHTFNATHVLGRVSDLHDIVKQHKVDEVLVAAPDMDDGLVLSVIAYCEAAKVTFRYVPKLFGVYNINVGASVVAGIPIISIRRTSLEGWGRIQKRLFDLIGSVVGLIILSPFFVLFSLLIVIESRGWPFFAHRRVGRAGRVFLCYKFRTMVADAPQRLEKLLESDPALKQEWDRDFKLRDDPRITMIGRFLRRTSLDELPQLINVLLGQMTLVGPRPVIEEELSRYGIYQYQVTSLKPGITGLWQVSGRNDVSYEERVRLDAYYVENWSLWLDIKTILKTFRVIFSRRGAY